MSTQPALPPRTVVAIINDDETYRKSWKLQVLEAGFEPYIVERPNNQSFASVSDLAEEVEGRARFAIFDHRLAPKHFAQFTGAEAIATLYDRRSVAPVLVTTYERQDTDTTIRLHRKKVPVLLSPEDFDDPEKIRRSLAISACEVHDQQISADRRPWRTAVQIEDLDVDSKTKVVIALVPGWRPDVHVTFPLDLIRADLRKFATPGQVYFALVNVGASRNEDLFFSDFELAPEADPSDGLA